MHIGLGSIDEFFQTDLLTCAYPLMDRPPLQDFDVDAALRTILEGTATQTGTEFFQALVKNLAFALNTHGAWVTEYFPESRRLRALAFWMGDQWLDGWEMAVDGTRV